MTGTFELIEATPAIEGIELRLAKIDAGYSVGIWDVDCCEYYNGIRLFSFSMPDALEKAKAYFAKMQTPATFGAVIA